MKRVGHLMEKVVMTENLELAFWKAQRHKQANREVALFRADLAKNLGALREAFLRGTMRFGPYRPFKLYDPKERTISVAPFCDRVAHHALMNVCEPVFERYAVFDTYACRTGKGSHAAVKRAQHFARRFPWFLKLDITGYYANIDHKLMLAALARLFKDPLLLRTFEHLLHSFSGPVRSGAGIPVGNLTSQHFANHFFGALDHWVKEVLHVRGYVRYMDDFVLWARHKAGLVDKLRKVRGFVRDRLKLEI